MLFKPLQQMTDFGVGISSGAIPDFGALAE
jgi:hypothetical protein